MVIAQSLRLRATLGWLVAALLLVALACTVDGLSIGMKGNALTVEGVPGESHPLTGPMPGGATTLQDVRVTGTDNDVQLVLEALQTGYWFGGSMWRATVRIAPDAKPGERSLLLEGPLLAAPQQTAVTLKIVIYRNAMAQRQASNSFIMRSTGLDAFKIAALLFAVSLPFVGGIFLVSRSMETQLAQLGLATIYMHKRSKEGETISFSMGLRQGLTPGMLVTIVDTAGRTMGVAEVISCKPEDATAKLKHGCVPQEAFAGIDSKPQ